MQFHVAPVVALSLGLAALAQAGEPKAPVLARRAAPKPTRIGSRNGPLRNIGSLIFRGLARAIVRIQIEGDLASIPRTGPLIVTAMPLRNLKTPVLTTVSPALIPCVMETKSPRASPTRTNACRIICDSFPVFGSFFFSITKTESP